MLNGEGYFGWGGYLMRRQEAEVILLPLGEFCDGVGYGINVSAINSDYTNRCWVVI